MIRYTTIGTTGLRVSEIALGAMRFGSEGAAEADRAIFDAYVEAGGNFIDTAGVYGGGASERGLKDLIAKDRDHLVIASKYGMEGDGGNIVVAGGSRKAMMASVDASLRRLGTDRLDILYLHLWDPRTAIDEVLRGMDDLVRQGKLLYAGLSNVPAWIAARAVTLADERRWQRPSVMQISYQPLDRTAERELLPMAKGLDIGVTSWSPLAQGMLTGRHIRPDDTVDPDAPIDERKCAILSALAIVARETGVGMAQVALAWARLRPMIAVIPVVGMDTVDQVGDAVASCRLDLDDAQVAMLDEVSAIDPGYPGDHLARPVFRNLLTAFQPERILPVRG